MSTSQHRTYEEFLRFFHQWKRILGPVDVEGQFGRLADQIASMYPEIRALPDPAERLEAARRVLFGEADSTPVVRLDRRCEFSLHSCPLGPSSLQFRDLCRFARMVLTELVGTEVEQTEWIVRGDPRCTFQVRTRRG